MARSAALILLLLCGCATAPVAPAATPAPPAAATALPAPPDRGAAVPWVEYEAEAATTNATTLEPTRTFGEIAAEASGRSAVRLEDTSDQVTFTTAAPANALVIRYALPDAPDGGGITETLSLYVDGTFARKLTLTSRYAWVYGNPNTSAETSNDPRLGAPHRFFDEARTLLDDMPAGSTLTLQKDADDGAAFYVIDLIDLEQVAPPAAMPAGSLSITECGATPDDASDDGQAILRCIEQARSEQRDLWIPAGTFESTLPLAGVRGFPVADLTIRGAGMWHSTLHGAFARFNCTGSNCGFADFAILGETTGRDDDTPDNGFNGAAGTGSRMERVWVEHTKVGWWVGDGARNTTDGLVITGSRFRNLFADGVNLCNGTSNSIVEQSHFRNTGDDAIASWAPSFDGGVNTANVLRFNTVQVPWRANCFAIYGGKDNRIEDSVCADTVLYPGVLIGQLFDAHPFAGTTTVERVTLVRAGGRMWNQQHGALKIDANQGPIPGLVLRDIQIESATFAGLHIQGNAPIPAARVSDIAIDGAGTWGVYIGSMAGEGIFTRVSVDGATRGGLLDNSLKKFVITRAEGNRGW